MLFLLAKWSVGGLTAQETEGSKKVINKAGCRINPAICSGAALRRPKQTMPDKRQIALAALVSCSLCILELQNTGLGCGAGN